MLLSTLAGLRAPFFFSLLFASAVYAREPVIFTSSVTYCNPPETLLIQQLDVVYFARNQSVAFNISAASVQANVNVTANLFLNVYGLHPVNYTIDLCDILGGALCPLPMYNFTGADTISLPNSLGVAGRIPVIAYKIPDLEGFAQLTLTEAGTGKVKACVQATLSNGWSMHQTAVEWVTAGFAIGALLSALWQSWHPEALAPFILLDLFYLYQAIASSSLLSLNYPSNYRSYALNFAWAMGLLSSANIQNSIDHMRHLTGGKLPNSSSGSPVGLVNRKLSPYNVPDSKLSSLQILTTRSTEPVTQFFKSLLSPIHGGLTTASDLQSGLAVPGSAVHGMVQTVTADSSNILQAGIPIYVNSLHIATANAFMTIFLIILVLSAIAIAAFVLIYLILFILERQDPRTRSTWRDLRHDYPHLARAWVLRMGLIIFTPCLIFIFYQWTLHDSWLSILLSVIMFIVVLGLVGHPALYTLRFAYMSSPPLLYSQQRIAASHGPLYARYRVSRYWFFAPFLIASTVKSVFIAFAKANGEAQIIGIMIVESLLLLALGFLRPFETRSANLFSIFLGIVRLVCSGLLIAFLERLRVNAIPRVLIGFVIVVIFSVTVIISFARIVITLPLVSKFCPWSKRDQASSSSSTSNGLNDPDSSTLEKGTKSVNSGDPEQPIGRPINPTPDHSLPRDHNFLHPYNFSPTASSPSTSTTPSMTSRDSATITVGSLLPRRWSITLSAPASPTNSSAQRHSAYQTISELSSAPHTPVTPISSVSHGPDRQYHHH
ncbi:hypothetical protein AX17_005781 [Amanita inopinata Kibby_2008]|nr:hypothetical protein AX17_005781 [Amanita inopinata Kibby_2008]